MRWHLFVLIVTLVALCAGCGDRIKENEKAAIAALKTIRDASAQFREQDCDRNGIQDYWTADVSGFYRVLDGKGDEIRKIPRELAMADGAPLTAIANYVGSTLTSTPVPYHGYYFRALTTDETATRYRQNPLTDAQRTRATNSGKFAFCAYPVTYEKTGKRVFIVSHEGSVWGADEVKVHSKESWPASCPKIAIWGSVDD